jgi:signal transduction histidine kinase
VASHELRTPLTVISGYVSMAEDGSLGELPPQLREVLPALHGEVLQLERLVEQMLVAARLDEELLRLDRRRLDLRQVARACLENYRSNPGAPSRHRLVLEMDQRPVPVQADAARLGDVLGNLVDNAIRYSPDGGEVAVRVGVRGRRAQLSVTDSGLGIEKADLGTIFSRFGRIVNAQNSHLIGAGLGLYLAREIARLHGGDIRVESKPGQGSTFTVSLPLAAPAWQRLRPAVARLARRARPAVG